jgi:hypothetical protein
MDNTVATDTVPDKEYTALVWYTVSYYNHTSGLKCTTIIIQELVPKEDIEWSSAYTTDRLYLEMCSTDKEAIKYAGPNFNWYYEQAATYARRASAGNFDGKNAKYKPIFHLDSKDFSPELRAHLVELVKTSKESLHRVVEDAVFKILRAGHRMIFYEHIEAEGLRWRFI